MHTPGCGESYLLVVSSRLKLCNGAFLKKKKKKKKKKTGNLNKKRNKQHDSEQSKLQSKVTFPTKYCSLVFNCLQVFQVLLASTKRETELPLTDYSHF